MKPNASFRFAAGAVAVVCGVIGICCLLLAVIGAQKGMVPTDAIAHIFGQPVLVRWIDETILGIPIARFWILCSLAAGLLGCILAIHFRKGMRSAPRSSETNQA